MTLQSFDRAFERVKGLVATFQKNESYYLSPSYSEFEARRQFIDEFWLAHGWDIYHKKQKDPYKQEVKVEHNVNVPNERRKRADYAFLAPNYRDVSFFVEAKKPQRKLENKDYYFQTVP